MRGVFMARLNCTGQGWSQTAQMSTGVTKSGRLLPIWRHGHNIGRFSVCLCRDGMQRCSFSTLQRAYDIMEGSTVWYVPTGRSHRHVELKQTNLPSISVHKMTTCTALPAQWASQLTRLALRYCCGLTGLYSTSFMLCCCGRDRVALTSRATGSSARGEIRSVPVPTSRHMGVLIILISDHHRFKFSTRSSFKLPYLSGDFTPGPTATAEGRCPADTLISEKGNIGSLWRR